MRFSVTIVECKRRVSGYPSREADAAELVSLGDNVFCHPVEDPAVRIRVGSIHSVKGETHTATLVLDTFYYKHSYAALKPWLLGQKSGGAGERPHKVTPPHTP